MMKIEMQQAEKNEGWTQSYTYQPHEGQYRVCKNWIVLLAEKAVIKVKAGRPSRLLHYKDLSPNMFLF